MYQKSQSYDVQCWKYGLRSTFFVILGYFLPFYPPPPHSLLMIPKIKILKKKKEKKMPGDIILLYIHVYHKYRSYDIWFLKYKLQQKIFLSFWAIFCAFSPLATQKIKNLKLKKTPGDTIILTHLHHKWQSFDGWFLRYGA